MSAFRTHEWGTGWRRRIGCLMLQIISCKRTTNYRALLRKMTYRDKASYGSPPLCMSHVNESCHIWDWLMSHMSGSCHMLCVCVYMSANVKSCEYDWHTMHPTYNSNLHGFELHRPSIKGTTLLFQITQVPVIANAKSLDYDSHTVHPTYPHKCLIHIQPQKEP